MLLSVEYGCAVYNITAENYSKSPLSREPRAGCPPVSVSKRKVRVITRYEQVIVESFRQSGKSW